MTELDVVVESVSDGLKVDVLVGNSVASVAPVPLVELTVPLVIGGETVG